MLQLFKTRVLFFILMLVGFLITGCAGSNQAAKSLTPEEVKYRESINGRAAKITRDLDLTDSTKFYKVRDIIARQYRDLRDIEAEKNILIGSVKKNSSDNKSEGDQQIQKISQAAENKTSKLHGEYIGRLGRYLNADQIDKVKDGMTYGVLPLTYKAHLEMIPSLKDEEKKYIWDALHEAREKAMDGGSSDEKHAIFGKYKGRINNYLSARGYDLGAERKAWNERIEAAKKRN